MSRLQQHIALIVLAGLLLASRAVVRAQARPSPAATQVSTAKLGVLAYRGVEDARRVWGPTADYLTQQIPGIKFEIVPLGYAEVVDVARRGAVDFIATSPSNYVELESGCGASRIAT